MNVKIKLIRETSKLPTRGTDGSAGHDLYADLKEPLPIWPGDVAMIPSGVAMEIPDGYYGALFARSGLATKEGLRLTTGTSVIDSDYRAEIGVGLYNDSKEVRWVQPGQRIAQLVFQKYDAADWEVVKELSDTERSGGGFGSTGKA